MSHVFNRARTAYRKQRAYQRTLRELNQMSDAEAQDLGLSRYDFPRLASEAVYGR